MDNVRVFESSGFLYRVKKFFTGSLDGESSLVVRYDNHSVPGEFWDTKAGKAVLEGPEYSVEHLRTDEHLNPTVARFTFGTVDEGEIAGFFRAFLDLEKEMR